MENRPFKDPAVESVFAAFPPKQRSSLMELRALIFETAAHTDGAGHIVETLRWSQPAYLTENPKSGSTIRIGTEKKSPDRTAMFFHCQTSLVATFRDLYPDELEYQGNRAILFSPGAAIPKEELKHCIALALTYHMRRTGRSARAS